MTDLQELEKIVKFCRKHGVLSLKTTEFDISLGPIERPESYYKRRKNNQETSSNDSIESDELTEEQILNWSVREGMNG